MLKTCKVRLAGEVLEWHYHPGAWRLELETASDSILGKEVLGVVTTQRAGQYEARKHKPGDKGSTNSVSPLFCWDAMKEVEQHAADMIRKGNAAKANRDAIHREIQQEFKLRNHTFNMTESPSRGIQ